MTSSNTFVSLIAYVFVINLKSVLDKVIGRQFSIQVKSLPTFGISFNLEALCDNGSSLVSKLNSHAFKRTSPKVGLNSLIYEYGIPSGPGAESLQRSVSPRAHQSSISSSPLLLGLLGSVEYYQKNL